MALYYRVDTEGNDGSPIVSYILDHPDYSFGVEASKLGVRFNGVSNWTFDYTVYQQVIAWAQYQAQKIKETGSSIPQMILEKQVGILP